MQTYESDTNIGSIKILAVDMDKTLLTDKRVLPQGLDERLDKLADAGIVFCPASGRPAPKLEEMFENIKNRLAFCPDNGACVIYRGSYIYKSNIDVALYQQVLARASEDPRAVPVLCCYDEFYVLARDHQYHDEISVYYNTINYVDSFEGLDIESNKISIFFPAYDAEPAFREDYSPEALPLGAAYRAQQHAVGGKALIQLVLGQRVAVLVNGLAAHGGSGVVEGMAVLFSHLIQHPEGLLYDLRAGAIAPDDSNIFFHEVLLLCSKRP